MHELPDRSVATAPMPCVVGVSRLFHRRPTAVVDLDRTFAPSNEQMPVTRGQTPQ